MSTSSATGPGSRSVAVDDLVAADVAAGHSWLVRCARGVPISVGAAKPDGADEVEVSDEIELRPKERTLVAALAAHHPRPVDTTLAASILWPDALPASFRQSLHNHLARIRRIAPDLVTTSRSGYRFGPGVSIEAPAARGVTEDSAAGVLLVELGSGATAGQLRSAFELRWSAPEGLAFDRGLREGAEELVPRLESAVLDQPHDERCWWRLMVANGALGRGDAVRLDLERARSALIDIGLEPSHRLLDVDRMVREGVRSVDQLMADPFGEPSQELADRLGASQVRQLDDVRPMLDGDDDVLITVAGDESFARREMLARIVDEARVRGYATAAVRCVRGEPLPQPPQLSWTRRRPTLIVIDGAEHASDRAGLIRRFDSVRLDATVPLVLVLTAGNAGASVITEPTVEAFVDDGQSLRPTPSRALTVTIDADAVPEPLAGPHALADLDDELLTIIRVLALLNRPVRPGDIAHISVEKRRRFTGGVRLGVLRHDVRTGAVDLTSSAVRDIVLGETPPDERARLAGELIDVRFPDEHDVDAAGRRARLVVESTDVGAPERVAAALAAARAARAVGDLVSMSLILRSALDLLEHAHGRSDEWCAVALQAARAELAAGDLRAELLLFDVIEVARRAGSERMLATAVLEFCRLGSTSTAGTTDGRMADLVLELLDEVHDDASLALIGGAASMVYSFTNEPDLLRQTFDTAERRARACGETTVLLEILPFAYLSLPLPSDVERRSAIADELEQLGIEHDRPDARWEALQLRLSNQMMNGIGDIRSTHSAMEHEAHQLQEQARNWEMQYIRANMALIDGDAVAAHRHLDRSLEFVGSVDPARVMAVFSVQHLAIALVEGETAAFVDAARDLVADQPTVGGWRAALALTAASGGSLDEATQAFDAFAERDDIEMVRDHTLTVSLIAFGEAALLIGGDDRLSLARERLEPFAGSWSWCGSCTFGPIDLTLARLALAQGDRLSARRLAASALSSSARLRAPRFAAAATDVLVTASE